MQKVCVLAFALVMVFTHTASGSNGSPGKTISIAPFSLRFPVVEVIGEFRLKRNMSLTGIVGAGGSEGSTILEVGGQFSYFVAGNFNSGMFLGFETVYTSISPFLNNSLVLKSGLSAGPFFGMRVTDDTGQTGGMQLGFAGVMDTDRENNSSSFKYVSGRLIIRIHVGWSF